MSSRVAFADPLAEPVDERGSLVPEPESQQGGHRERPVAHPGEPVVPVALAADLLGQPGGGRRDGCAGRGVDQQLERDRRAVDHVAPAAAIGGAAQPALPKQTRLFEERGDRGLADRMRADLALGLEHQPDALACAELDVPPDPAAVARQPGGVEHQRQVGRAEHRPALGDAQLVRLASVVEARIAVDLEAHRAPNHADDAHDAPVPRIDAGIDGRHKVDDLTDAGRTQKARREDGGIRQVELLDRPLGIVGGDPEAAAVVGVQQRGEHARRIEARQAQPVDRSAGRHQRRGVQVADEAVLGNGRLGHSGFPSLVRRSPTASAPVFQTRGCRRNRQGVSDGNAPRQPAPIRHGPGRPEAPAATGGDLA